MKSRDVHLKDGARLENEVARIYSLLGGEPKTRVLIKGYEIDVISTFQMGPITFTVMVECKEYSERSRVSDVDMRSFVAKLLAARELGRADKGVFVTTSGFTKNALATAYNHGIQCLTLADLRDQLVDFSPYVRRIVEETEASPLSKHYVEQTASDVEDYATILGSDATQEDFHKPLIAHVDQLFLSGERRIALLGNFGTGKSAFCDMYCYLGISKYRSGSGARLPVKLLLREFRSGFDIHQLVVRVLSTQYGVSIDERRCRELQRMGRFIFVLDGLDEMATKVDRSVLNENLREIARLSTDGDNLYVLTCRTHFFQERVVEEFLDDYRVLYLLEWNSEDLRAYLARRFPRRWNSIYSQLTQTPRLEELSRTPQFVDMLLEELQGKGSNPDFSPRFG